MKNSKANKILIIMAVLLMSLLMTCIYVFFIRIPSANEVYNESIEYIVELKSQSNDDVSYGTAVMLLNAHL